MQLSSLVEIKRWVMWWGTECEVLEPEELRELIAREVREMALRDKVSGTKKTLTGTGLKKSPKAVKNGPIRRSRG